MLKILKRYYPELILLGIVSLIFIKNYIPGTYLIGWDSLQTELYPWLAVKRAFFSVWEEYQSLGLTTGMAHAADLVRAVFIFLLSFVLNKGLIRYVFHHLMLLIGGLGAYNLFNYLGFKSKSSVFALLGATFYILNLGTAQMFGVPFEPFSVFFAFLPWEILFFTNYIEDQNHSKKNLISFIIVNILATPQAYQQAIFVVYILIILLLILGVLIKGFMDGDRKRIFIRIRSSLYALLMILIINSFWILPQIYSLRFSANTTRQAKINQLATNTMINQNIEKGKIQYLARFENFYYDLKDTKGDYLFSSWRSHFDNKQMLVLSYIPFVLIIIGLFFGNKKYSISLIGIFVFISLIFLSGTTPLSLIGDFLRNISIMGQVFRSPFTKFIFPYVLLSAYFFALGLDVIYSHTLGLLFKEWLPRLSIALYVIPFFALIFLVNISVFKGNLFLPQMKIKIPDQYFQLAEYFKGEDKSSRIALLPDYTFWGWFQNNWGYDGSGFLWYGIEQPIISRTFDVWSKESESYFWEIKNAIESQNAINFKKLLDKYNVDYLIVDYSLKPVTAVDSGLQYEQISEIIRNSIGINLVKSFSSIDVFKVTHTSSVSNFSSVAANLPNVGFGYDLTDYDSAYFDIGTYYVDKNSEFNIIYPFNDLMTQTDRFSRSWKLSETEDSFVLSADLRGIDQNGYEVSENNAPLKAEIFDGEKITYYDLSSLVYKQENKIRVEIKKILVDDIKVKEIDVVNCRNNLLTEFGKEETQDNVLQIYSKNKSTACFSYGKNFLAHWNSYLVKVGSERVSGEPLFFYITGSKSSTQSKIEDNLSLGTRYYILPAGNYFDDGYTFGFQNISYNDVESRNILKELKIYLFTFEYIKNIKLAKKNTSPTSPIFSNLSDLKKINYSLYYSRQGSNSNNTFILYQAYDEGWVAICNLKLCDADHVKINNWANGWIFSGTIPNGVFILYWPQLLQFLGYTSMIILVILAVFRKLKLTNN